MDYKDRNLNLPGLSPFYQWTRWYWCILFYQLIALYWLTSRQRLILCHYMTAYRYKLIPRCWFLLCYWLILRYCWIPCYYRQTLCNRLVVHFDSLIYEIWNCFESSVLVVQYVCGRFGTFKPNVQIWLLCDVFDCTRCIGTIGGVEFFFCIIQTSNYT